MQLTITSGSATNPQTLDLSLFIDVNDGAGMDPYDPAFTDKVISHSLLKEGGFFALEDLQAKELVFPLKLNDVSTGALLRRIAQLNQVITTPGAVAAWQDDNASQPTYFDLLSGQFDIQYRYREAQRFWTSGKLRLFARPFGRVAAPRPYAAGSTTGPLMVVSPSQTVPGSQTTLGFFPSESWIPLSASQPGGVAVNGSNVFWANTPSAAIGRANLDGTAPSQLWLTGASGVVDLTVDSSFIYWAGPSAIGRANLTGTSPSALWLGASQPGSVAVNGSQIYWTSQPGGAVGNANLSGAAPSHSWIAGVSGAQGVITDQTWVYYGQDTAAAIGRASLGWVGTPITIAPSQNWLGTGASTLDVAVDANFVYWTNTASHAIGRANLDGTGASGLWLTVSGASSLLGVAVDANYIYWTNVASAAGIPPSFSPSATGYVGRALLNGNLASALWMKGDPTLASATGVAVDANYVYVTNGKEISRGGLDATGLNAQWISGTAANAITGVTAGGSYIYWADNRAGTIGRAALNGANPNFSWITGASGAWAVKLGASAIYWTGRSQNTIGRANLDGSGASQAWITGASSPMGIALDSQHLYWVNDQNNEIGRANQVLVSFIGAPPTPPTFLTGIPSVTDLAINASQLYWTSPAAIGRVDVSTALNASQTYMPASAPHGLALDSTYLYWTNTSPTWAVARSPQQGSFTTQQTAPTVSYLGAPSLAGDATGLLQVSYVGPLPNLGMTNNAQQGAIPYTALSLLPDTTYPVLFSGPQIAAGIPSSYIISDPGAVNGQYVRSTLGQIATFQLPAIASTIPISWAGNHRLFAIARASQAACALQLVGDVLVPDSTQASVNPGDWQIIDLGTLTLRPSETPLISPTVQWSIPPGGSGTADVSAFVMLPERSTWFLNPTVINPSQYGGPVAINNQGVVIAQAPYTNTLLIDDTLAGQFVYTGATQTFAPPPAGMAASSARITQYSRGLVPAPDPRDGIPILALLGIAPAYAASSYLGASTAWTNPQNLGAMVQVNVLERTRYIFP